MDIISSNSNKYVKLLKSLSDKKSRDENGLFLAEGERLIKDMPSDYSTEFMLVAQNKLDEFSYLTAGKKFFAATESVIKYACDTVTPSGIVAAVKKVSRPFELPRSNALLLDSLQDSGNVGTIIRTAVSCGFDDIYLYRCADAFDYIFTGDTLFFCSCGRTDFPGGSSQEIIASLKKIAALDGDLKVMPGHDRLSNLNFERENNPYMKM